MYRELKQLRNKIYAKKSQFGYAVQYDDYTVISKWKWYFIILRTERKSLAKFPH